MHPHNLVFYPATLRRLVEGTGATHIGAELAVGFDRVTDNPVGLGGPWTISRRPTGSS
ncbi:hypothetical protein [Streptomyces sp. NPDC058297]|uniref:hypothetical protein n=1 Tax=Streptomyces sp. NPDC058297 TaxID=3346433 RepID=UPI0036EE7EAC